jgi:hypothetical protein
VAIVKNVKKYEGSNENEPPWLWDVESDDGKTATFYPDKEGRNIWQQGVHVTKTHIATSFDDHPRLIKIDASTNIDDIKEQVQVLANNGFFDKYFK